MFSRERVLPEGDVFGNIGDDEFTIELNEDEFGVFKRFEYLSTPFSITENEDIFEEVLEEAEQNGSSFAQELERNEQAQEIVQDVYHRMRENPAFSKEVLDSLLAEVYVDDNIIADIDSEDSIESKMGKFTAGWKHLADFYAIEGLVGGDAEEINPFLEGEASQEAGSIDGLETVLPALRENLGGEEWLRTKLQLSSIVGRDYEQIEHATNVLNHIHGDKDYDQEFVERNKTQINQLAHTGFDSNVDFGKFYNTLIRFHNWMPLKIKEDGQEGDQYDSICAPAKDAMEDIEDLPIHDSLSEIGDATSPKGLALSWLIDEEIEVDGERVGDRERFESEEARFSDLIDQRTTSGRDNYSEFTLNDHAMYPGLTGGKWKGIKLLNDAREALDLDYEVPDGEVISSIGTERMLEDVGISEVLEDNITSLDESSRQDIIEAIDEIDVSQYVDLRGNSIMRSSMYGEDGTSNFAGIYDSQLANGAPEEAFKEVLKSYFSPRAVDAREDKGLTHNGAISVIMQEAINPEEGGVVHLTGDEYALSVADNPEAAVDGDGTNRTSSHVEDLVEDTHLEGLEGDLRELQRTFGDIDVEYVSDGDEVFLTQMRPKYSTADVLDTEFDSFERVQLEEFDEIYDVSLNGGGEYVLEMDFLGRENIMDRVDELNEFIRENESNIAGVEGHMPRVAHVPNNIESHFGIPYQKAE